MYYEATLLMREGEEKISTLWESIMEEVEKLGATIEKQLSPFAKTLAYPIKSSNETSRHAYMGVFYLAPKKEPSLFLKALQDSFASRPEVLRYMITRISEIPREKAMSASFPSEGARRRSIAHQRISPSATQEGKKEEKPSLEELDKKLEEILEDKIGY